jgi:hypothetical protein
VYPKPDFAVYTAGKAGFGVIGAALIIRAENEIVREHAVGRRLQVRVSRNMSSPRGRSTVSRPA